MVPVSERVVARLLAAAMVLLLPWPFYLVAVLGVTPIPVLVVDSVVHPMLLVLVLPQAALGVWIFHRVARVAARDIAASRAPAALAVGAVAVVVAITFLPVYGGGENLLGSRGKFHNLYVEMMHNLGKPVPEEMEALERASGLPRARPLPATGPGGRPLTIEDLGAAQVRIEPRAPIAITLTPSQIDCMKGGKSSDACGVVIAQPPSRRVTP